MKVQIDNINNIKINKKNTMCIGNFDGIHLGHQQLLKKLEEENNYKTVMTFLPHPTKLFNPNFKSILTLEDKINIFSTYNIDELIIVEINMDFLNLSKIEFINILKKLNVEKIIIGEDFKFGKNNSGKISDLEEYFPVKVIKLFYLDNLKVSSTRIKELLDNGNIKQVNKLLTRNYHLKSKVTHGNEIGRKIGFPTANIIDLNTYLPKNGVYYVNIVYENEKYKGILNIGHNPSINYSKDKRIEVNIIDFNGYIYDEYIDIYFIDFIRDELKFNSKTDLINQITKDKELILNYEIDNGNCS